FGVGPMVLSNANRAIVLQPKFEVDGIREKVWRFLNAVYGSEDDFYRYCTEFGVQYYLYDIRTALPHDKDSDRYVAGKPRLDKESAAFLFHFRPERLGKFQLVFQNGTYRVFQVGETGLKPPEVFAYQPVYDLALYGKQADEDRYFDDSHTAAILGRLDQASRLFQAGFQDFEARKLESCQARLRRALRLNPSLPHAHSYRGLSLAMLGDLERGIRECNAEVVLYPRDVTGHYNLGYAYYLKKEYASALKVWRQGHRLDPTHPGLVAGIVQLTRHLEKRGGGGHRESLR
ncbi:tetratricopeptide repeat protein, partial [Acidobacteriota bacterium]